MLKKIFLLYFIFLNKLYAFSCFFTLAKDNCWINYTVKVSVMDSGSRKEKLTIEIPKGKTWTRKSFSCQPGEKIFYQATYTPIFWESERTKVYYSIRYWSLPASIGKEEQAWNIPICFSTDFAEVPLPPDAVGNCHCDWTKVSLPTLSH